MSLTPDFERRQKKSSDWYDVEYDRILIEQSIAKQYGVLPSEQGNLRYADWAKLVGGLMDDTPLLRTGGDTPGRLIEMSSAGMTSDQLRIRSEWRTYQASRQTTDTQDMAQQQQQLQAMIAAMFG